MTLGQIWGLLVHAIVTYKLYEITLIGFGIIVFFFLKRDIFKLRRDLSKFILDYAEAEQMAEQNRKASNQQFSLLLERFRELRQVAVSPSEQAPVATSPNSSTTSADERWEKLQSAWNEVKKDLWAVESKVYEEVTDSRRLRRYKSLDGRNYENIIGTLFNDKRLGASAYLLASEMNSIFNSRKNKRVPVSDIDWRDFSYLYDKWQKLKENDYKED